MNAFAEFLKHHVKENPHNYGSDAQSILEILCAYCHECNNTDTVRTALGSIYQRIHGVPFREMSQTVDAVCAHPVGIMRRRGL